MSLLPAFAQDVEKTQKVEVSVNADVVSRYVWRGLLLSPNPNIQPTIALTMGNFTVGSWASYGISENYAEIDLFLTYSIGSFSVTLYDYFNEMEPDMAAAEYFSWKREETGHALEGTLAWAGTENFPLKITGALFFYGNDRDTVTLEQNFSSYLEIGYPVQLGDYTLDFFAGGTFNEGFYHEKAHLVNLGISASKEIAFSEKFALPVKASFMLNPAKEDVFFTVGVTF